MPTDVEIQGDPRTKEGSSYPDDAKKSERGQMPIGQSHVDEEDQES